MPASPKPFPMDITTPWTTLVPACLKTSPPKTQSGASSLGWPQTGTSPHKRPFIDVHLLLSDRLIDAQHLPRDHNKTDHDDPVFEASFSTPHTFGPSQDVQLVLLFTDRAATSTLEVTALTRIPRQHSPWAIMRFRPGHSGEFDQFNIVTGASAPPRYPSRPPLAPSLIALLPLLEAGQAVPRPLEALSQLRLHKSFRVIKELSTPDVGQDMDADSGTDSEPDFGMMDNATVDSREAR
ncbi:hypothetical protein BJV77DRAFT_1157159 [Russula vinacea]|nr:hypothetical protein BJV77DRAFT_1157159 [Russula vinacea]